MKIEWKGRVLVRPSGTENLIRIMVEGEEEKEIKQILEQDIVDICNKRTIKNLVETVIDIQKVEKELLAAKSLIDNCEKIVSIL